MHVNPFRFTSTRPQYINPVWSSLLRMGFNLDSALVIEWLRPIEPFVTILIRVDLDDVHHLPGGIDRSNNPFNTGQDFSEPCLTTISQGDPDKELPCLVS